MNNKNRKQIKIEELKKIQIEMLDFVHKFCIDNNINYWLDWGTLLGAIRHKGYIPWDDDIDIGMLRKDYDKFIRIFPSNKSSIYDLHCFENDNNYYLAFAKIYDNRTVLFEPDEKTGHKGSVFIDVFVYDNAPEDMESQKKIYRKKEFYRVLNSISVSKKFDDPLKQKYNIVRYPMYYILKLFPKNFFLKKQIRLQKKYNNKETNYIGNYSGKGKMVCNKQLFNKLIEVEFEGKKYKAPIGYDEYLTTVYGNYMELPSKEKQVSNHSFVAFYK